MTVDRLTRVNELLKREIGEALFQIIKEDDFDLSAVTITHVITSRSLQNARVMVSIRDHQDERPRMLSLLRKHRGKIQERIGKNVILKYTPRLIFELDTSIEKGDAVLSLLHDMERHGELPSENPETSDTVNDGGESV
ncbi:MAG: 30S ribosome-binding factor RbfA [Kiritimatiellae bacterium]|nr:30S ribosome-binding factor RbfA [Kiritimatiellia bacterium]MDD5519334.1 30S ribosome-binding factor RbfA [Kiritimatiellia bacterium]